MTPTVVQQLYEFNTLPASDLKMFHDLEMDNYYKEPDFSKVTGVRDRRRALHLIDLEIREIDSSITAFRGMVAKDSATPKEDEDRNILANELDFRTKLTWVRGKVSSSIVP